MVRMAAKGRLRISCTVCDVLGRRRVRHSSSLSQTDNIFAFRPPPEPATEPQRPGPSSKGPLAGWTVSIKDNICTADMPTTCASRMLEAYRSPFDAETVQSLRRAGAHLIGKTNCDEFGMGSMNIDSAFGPIANPAVPHGQPERVTGGSSGGAAASVAAGYCRVAIGSDTGGSIRLPAAYCGVYGLKPSYGLLSRWGLVAYADSLDTIGIMARSAEDVEQTFQVLAHPDAKDPTSMPQDVRQAAQAVADDVIQRLGKEGKPLTGLRVGVPQEFFAEQVAPRILCSLRQVLTRLRLLGAEVVPIHLDHVRYALSAYYVLATAEASSNLARYDGIRYGARTRQIEGQEGDKTSTGTAFSRHVARTRSETFGKEVQKRILLGTYSLTSDLFDNYFLQAQRVRQLIRADFDRAFRLDNVLRPASAVEGTKIDDRMGVDVLVSPSAVDVAPLMDEARQQGRAAYTQDLLTVPASLAGVPAISVPTEQVDGLPVGVTLTTQWGCEDVLWRVLQHVGRLT